MKTVFFLIVFLFIPITGYAVTIHVPGDYSTIQKAIDAAGSGDMVLVSPGTYVENIDFMGKAITVKSSNGPDVTVIDGNKKSSVVTFSSGEGHDSVLDGFSITNGSGTYDGYDQCGGGIYCKDSSPTLKNLIVQNNRVDMSGGYANGGGIYCSNSTAVITSCNITNNMVGLWSGSGAGIYSFNSSLVVSNNVISGNQVLATGMGGGVFSDGQSDHISNNMVFENSSGAFDGNGGGMAIFGMADLEITPYAITRLLKGTEGVSIATRVRRL